MKEVRACCATLCHGLPHDHWESIADQSQRWATAQSAGSCEATAGLWCDVTPWYKWRVSYLVETALLSAAVAWNSGCRYFIDNAPSFGVGGERRDFTRVMHARYRLGCLISKQDWLSLGENRISVLPQSDARSVTATEGTLVILDNCPRNTNLPFFTSNTSFFLDDTSRSSGYNAQVLDRLERTLNAEWSLTVIPEPAVTALTEHSGEKSIKHVRIRMTYLRVVSVAAASTFNHRWGALPHRRRRRASPLPPPQRASRPRN